MLLAAVCAAVAGTACTFRLWADPAARAVSGNIPDATHYSWWLAHTPFAILHGQSPFATPALNWPGGVSAMNNNSLLLPSIVLGPITWLFGSLATLNVLTILSVPLCIAASFWALRQQDVVSAQSGDRLGVPAALAGAAGFGISPAIVNSLVGHVTMSLAPLLPVLLVLGVRAWQNPRPVPAGLLLGLVATAQIFIGEEVLFQAGIASLMVALTAAVSRPSLLTGALSRLARSAAAAFAVLLLIAGYPLYLQFFGPLAQHGSPFLPNYFGADLTAFWTTSDRLLLHTDAGSAASALFPGGVEEHLAFLGVPLLVFCLLVVVLGWRTLLVRCAGVGLFLCLVLSLGGRIWVGGVQHSWRGPYAILQSLPVAEASLATRLALPAALFAGLLLALGLQALLSAPASPRGSRRTRCAVAGVVAVACLAPLLPRPLPVEQIPSAPRFFTRASSSIPKGSVLVVLPYPTAVETEAMRWQVAAGFSFSMPGGYFLGPGPGGHAYVGGDADPALARALADVARTGQPAAVTPEFRAQALQDLRAWHPEMMVLGPSPAAVALRATLTQLLGQGPEMIDGVEVWRDPAGLLS